MTVATPREFAQKISCPECGCEFTKETALSRWMRTNKDIWPNGPDVTFTDIDYFAHRFKTDVNGYTSRDVQCGMFIEAKTRGRKLEKAQEDDLATVDQLVRNQARAEQNLQGHEGRIGVGHPHRPFDIKVWSAMAERMVLFHHYGMFLLSLSGDSPQDSKQMSWRSIQSGAQVPITQEQLVQLLRFELNPLTLRTT